MLLLGCHDELTLSFSFRVIHHRASDVATYLVHQRRAQSVQRLQLHVRLLGQLDQIVGVGQVIVDLGRRVLEPALELVARPLW